nr:hypothetical protein [Brevundimonas sp.]
MKLFAPLSVMTPEPCLTMAPVPLIDPANAVLAVEPKVKMFPPSRTFVPVPPTKEPIVWVEDAADMSNVDPLFKDMAVVASSVPEPLRARVPAAMSTPPVKLFAPPSVVVPEPCLMMRPAPVIEPLNVVLLASPRVRFREPSRIWVPATLDKAPIV